MDVLYLGISIFLAIITLVLPPLGLVTVPLWIILTVLKAVTVLFQGAMK
jgi:hypothetical protein